MHEIEIGIVGAGVFGEEHAKHFACMPTAEISGIFDPDTAKAERLCGLYGGRACASLAELLGDNEIRLVSIVTPESAHRESFLEAAAAGKAIYLEKPLATTMEDVAVILDASRNVIAFGGHLLRFETRYRQIGESLAEYGRLFHMNFRRMRSLANKVYYHRTHPALILLSHDFNLASWYAGSPFVRVISLEGRYRGEETPDTVSVLVEYENGATGCFEGGWAIPDQAGYDADDRCSVACENGAFELRTPGVDFYQYHADGVQFPNPYYDIKVGGNMYGPLRASLDYAVDCVIRGEQPEENTLEQAAETVTIGLAAIRSAEESRYVSREEILGSV